MDRHPALPATDRDRDCSERPEHLWRQSPANAAQELREPPIAFVLKPYRKQKPDSFFFESCAGFSQSGPLFQGSDSTRDIFHFCAANHLETIFIGKDHGRVACYDCKGRHGTQNNCAGSDGRDMPNEPGKHYAGAA